MQASNSRASWRAGEPRARRPAQVSAHRPLAGGGFAPAGGAPARRAFLRRNATVLPLVCCGLLGAVAFVWLTDGGRTARAAAPLVEQVDRMLVAAGFGINEVWLRGHRFTVDSDIFAALELESTGSLVRFDPRAARARIEAMPWIDTATVSRVFPDQLRVLVVERKPVAVWIDGGREALVDASGRVLARVTPGAAPDLPRIRGAGAPAAAADLMAILRRHSGIGGKVAFADRIASRRWRLVLDNATTVQLPATGQEAAIDRLADLHARLHLLDQASLDIDLRLTTLTPVRRTDVRLGRNAGARADLRDGT